jgi:hypothetical protein
MKSSADVRGRHAKEMHSLLCSYSALFNRRENIAHFVGWPALEASLTKDIDFIGSRILELGGKLPSTNDNDTESETNHEASTD